jgi:hypothetical protein
MLLNEGLPEFIYTAARSNVQIQGRQFVFPIERSDLTASDQPARFPGPRRRRRIHGRAAAVP